MKKLFFTALLLIAISIATFAKELVAEGKTYSVVGDYKIEMADEPVIINGEQLKTYIITYQNYPSHVKVAIQKTKKCKNFIVLSNELSMKYVCTEKYFGVEKLNLKEFKTNNDNLNMAEYFHQRVLTSGENSEIDNARLIAAYFHALVKL